MLVFKIFREAELAHLMRRGETQGAPVDLTDGFVHLSTAEQLAETAAKHFKDDVGLWVLAVETDNLDRLEWEPSRGGALFPHLYRSLRLSDIKWIRRMALGATGHVLPEGVL